MLSFVSPARGVHFQNWAPVEMKLWGVFQMAIEKDLYFHWKNCSIHELLGTVVIGF